MIILKALQPFLNLCLACAHFVSVDAELARDLGLRESFFHIAGAGGEAAAFVSSKGDDGFSVEVDVLEEGEHHLRIGAPPHRAADEDGVVWAEVGDVAFVWRQFALVGFLFSKIDKRRVGHAVVLMGDDLKLVGTFDFSDVVGHDLGVADLAASAARWLMVSPSRVPAWFTVWTVTLL